MNMIAQLAPVIMVGLLGLALLMTMGATGIILLVISARAQGAWNAPPQTAGPAPDIIPAFVRDGD